MAVATQTGIQRAKPACKTRLSEVAQIKHGFAFAGEYFRGEPPGDVLLTPGNFAIGGGFKSDKLKFYVGHVPEEYVLSPGDLLVTMTDLSVNSDTLGYPAIVPLGTSRYLHNQRLGKVIITRNDLVDVRYLYYLLCTADYKNEVVSTATGTTVKHTSPSRILAYETILPSLATQRQIGQTIGALDDKIELNRRINQTLEKMACALFNAWFVDFLPVKAKAAGAKSFPGMNPGIFATLSDELCELDGQAIPKGWTFQSISNAYNVFDGKRIPLSANEREKRKGIFPYYGAAGVLDHIDDYLFDGTYLLVGEDGTVTGKANEPMIQYVAGQFWVNNHAHVLQGRPPYSTEHLMLMFMHVDITPFVTGAVQPKLSQGQMQRIQVVIPPPSISEAFNRPIEPLFAMIRSLKAEQEALAEMRNSLLRQIFAQPADENGD
jgi:type I restriction enzyme, S subunit